MARTHDVAGSRDSKEIDGVPGGKREGKGRNVPLNCGWCLKSHGYYGRYEC